MFEKNMRLAYLLDFYGEALDAHTKDVMTAYYEDDLSLSEIAEDEGISRQGVRHIIKKGEEQLDFLESRLGLAEHNTKIKQAEQLISSVVASLSKNGMDAFSDEIEMLRKVSEILTEK